jgi:multidrug resistance efflux pump
VPEISHRLPRRTWVRRALPAGVVAILVVGGTVIVRNNATASPVDTYRTTTVTTGSVEQRLNLTGSAQRVNQASQGFAVTGTVSSVSVAVGDTVKAGQTLATLDPAPLHSAVISATASLAKAKATLESDQSTTTTATTATTATGGTSGTSGTSLATATTPVSTPVATATPTTSPRVAGPSGRKGAGTSLAQAQQHVTSAQQAITADLRRASAALALCGPFFPSESTTSSASPTAPAPSPTASASSAATTSTATPTSTSTSGPTPTSTPTSTATPTSTTTASTSTPSDAEIKACVSALRTAPTQQQIQRHQQALTDSQSVLTTTVTLAITTATNTANTPDTTSRSTTTGQSSTSQSAASRSSGSQSSGSRSSGSQSSGSQSSGSQSSGGQADQSSGGLSSGTGQSSASRAVTDQAAVTNAEAALSSAQADLTSATLKSSIGGTVGSVSLVKGASSQSKSVVIVGTGAVEVTVDVPLASIGTVHVGQKANVTPQGATSIAAGSVTSISLLPSTSSSSTGTGSGTGSGTGQGTSTTSSPTYPVVVLVPHALPALATGSRADVSLLIGTVSKVLTVPNSALTPLAKGQAMAVTLKNGVSTRALVKTGYAGTLTTQITSGLSAGQQVVLADLNTALPTNTTSSRRLGVAGGSAGGLGSAGLGGGSLPGGTGFPPP